MATREEIREVIDAYTDDVCLYQDNPCEFQSGPIKEIFCCDTEGSYRCLMKRLDGLGVVVKVDRELPIYYHNSLETIRKSVIEYHDEFSKACCGFFEPLVDEAVEPLI